MIFSVQKVVCYLLCKKKREYKKIHLYLVICAKRNRRKNKKLSRIGASGVDGK